MLCFVMVLLVRSDRFTLCKLTCDVCYICICITLLVPYVMITLRITNSTCASEVKVSLIFYNKKINCPENVSNYILLTINKFEKKHV